MESSSRRPPLLRAYPLDSFAALDSEAIPSQKIRSDEDVERWKHTRGYLDYMLFLRRLNEAVVGTALPLNGPQPSKSVFAILHMLDKLDRWIDDIPPQPTPQRFGNLAFRVWGKCLEENAQSLLETLLPDSLNKAVPLLAPYLTSSFGSFVRMDYGTGHETSFAAFLLCLTLVRFLCPDPEEERHIVCTVFLRYLRLCWRLQDVYRLEPAGSHGVWGLDDSHFLPFIFGSAQLRGSDVAVNTVLQNPLPATNLYFMSIMRIHEVKTGPFYEHSSQLYAIATGVAHWGKVNSGLFKMYEAEVLGKRVVVQHLPLGGLFDWDTPASADQAVAHQDDAEGPVRQGLSTSRKIIATPSPMTSDTGRANTSSFMPTAAPWAQRSVPLKALNPATPVNRSGYSDKPTHTNHIS